MILYKEHSVWSKLHEDVMVNYVCFENLSTGNFHVQSADYYYKGQPTANKYNFERQKLDLLFDKDQAIEEGILDDKYKTLTDAITSFLRDFGQLPRMEGLH